MYTDRDLQGHFWGDPTSHVICHQLGRLASESACEQEDLGSNPAADMVDAARNTAWDLGKQPNNYRTKCSSVPAPVMVAFVVLELIFGLVFIIIGSLNVDKCKIDPMIPIWLIMMGVVYIVTGVHEFIQYTRAKKSATKGRGIVALIITGVITLVTVGLFIAGNVFVYTAWGVEPDYGHYWFENGCDMATYLLAFSGVIIMDALFGIIILGVIFYAVLSCCKK
ncbi:hypothetical protein FHG87_006308 [Trinorchestia longiramus]|nr:hypothetical protein FHG87_006308 [Trinorchestia longiramus]